VAVTCWKLYVETPKKRKPPVPRPAPIFPPQMDRSDSD
jgi:hypothetical protein